MEWQQIHEKALTLAKQFKKAQAELIDVLEQIDSKKIFRTLGYSSLWDYCLRALCLSESDADSFIRIARKCQSVPELKLAIEQGQINVSAARRVCSVITAENKHEWLDLAKRLSQRELEKEIVKGNPKAKVFDKLKPLSAELTELRCSISKEVEALIRKVQDLESKRQKKNCSLDEAFRQMALFYLEKKDPMQQAKQKKGIGPVTKSSVYAVTKSSVLRRIPNQVRHAMSQRDEGRCVFVDKQGERCHHRRFTQIHHIRPYFIGGSHEVDNLATLCFSHHKAIHEGVMGHHLDLRGAASST